ncbi:ankyrin repeat domain-containing protein [Bosea beijingensis]|uniref:ankyrin repeat domain-containing protein n=1 Tax=Bosea beijingensis TaxID=3068632 RepID=UPI0027417FAD|nr:ankyrin repeat domain-containing protein [Bosea sp. REN20]
MARMLLIAVALVAAALFGRAVAQTPPDATELAAYRGLHAAAAVGDIATIRRLADAGEKLDQRDSNGRTPLHVAAFRGQAEAIRALIVAGADSGLFDNQRYDAVTIVSVTDDVPALKALLASGASAKLTTSRYDGTALIAAAHLGHDGIVRELIKAGAPLDHVNNLGWTALIEAVILGDGGKRHVETVRALLAAGADRNLADRQGATPLQHARSRGYAAMVALLEAGAPR